MIADGVFIQLQGLYTIAWSSSLYLLHSLKGHGNEADFLGFLHKLDPHRSLALLYLSSRSDFGFEFAEILVIEKRLADSASRGVAMMSRGVAIQNFIYHRFSEL
jgi:hypothetical protein